MGRRAGEWWRSPTSTSASPPGMRTITLRSTRPQRWKTSAETVAPVPQALVMPAPRSQTRREISSVPLTSRSAHWPRRRSGRSRVRRGPVDLVRVVDLADDMRIADVARFQRFTDATGAPTASMSSATSEQARRTTPMSTVRSRRGAHRCRAPCSRTLAGVDTLR